MTDKEYGEQKKRVKKLIDKYQRPLGFNWWGITHEFHRKPIENHEGAAATTSSQWEYRNALIKWCLPEVQGLTDDQLDECVLHELCHILIAPIETYEDSMAERCELAVTNVQRAIKWAYESKK